MRVRVPPSVLKVLPASQIFLMRMSNRECRTSNVEGNAECFKGLNDSSCLVTLVSKACGFEPACRNGMKAGPAFGTKGAPSVADFFNANVEQACPSVQAGNVERPMSKGMQNPFGQSLKKLRFWIFRVGCSVFNSIIVTHTQSLRESLRFAS
jgi:hypothetical protein